MARIWAITAALGRAVIREQRHLRGLMANNLFWVLYLVGQGGAGPFVFLLVGLVALAPMCADPFRRLPPDRAGTWPVAAGEMRLVRLLSIGLSPAVWIAAAALVWTRRAPWMLLIVAAGAFAVPFPRGLAFRAVPGIFGELVRKNVRELLSLLDPYIALLLTAAMWLYRASGRPLEPEAFTIMSLVIVVLFSTCAQALFALDAGASLERYRLMPVRGWKVLAAKHAALAIVAAPLALPLHPLAASTALLVAMAYGNHAAVTNPRLHSRWSLTAGALIPGLFQCVLLVAAGLYAVRESAWILAAAAAAYILSTAFYGWRFERGPEFR